MTSFMENMRKKCIEPQKRNKDGVRWIVHRFPIKGGISVIDMLRRDFVDMYADTPQSRFFDELTGRLHPPR